MLQNDCHSRGACAGLDPVAGVQFKGAWIPAWEAVSQLTEMQILLLCHSRAGGNPFLFQDVRLLDAGSSPA